MAHLLETMAYANEVPWHGLGARVDGNLSVADMMTAAQLNWDVTKEPMFKANGDKIDGFFALSRSSDNSVLDVVGKAYTPIQNHEAFEFFTEFVEAGSATMETAGSLKSGRMVWGLANLNASFKMAGNDEVKGYLLVGCPHEQGKSVIMKFTTVRVVCNNTLTLALATRGKNEVRIAHRRGLDKGTLERAKSTMGIAREQLDQFETTAKILKKKSMCREDAIAAFATIYQENLPIRELLTDFEERANPTMLRLMDINSKAPGADPLTAWGVLNAVTYYADHVASLTPDKRLTNAWMGKTARQKEDMLELLLAA